MCNALAILLFNSGWGKDNRFSSELFLSIILSIVCDFLNSIDIDLSGLSNGEGWNLPSFNATALGKWSVVSNCSAHKDWATDQNCILVDPVGKQDCYDNFFFKEGMPFNQGQYYKLNGDDILAGFDKAVERAGQKNTEGTKLRDKFTYSKTVDSILDYIYSDLETA